MPGLTHKREKRDLKGTWLLLSLLLAGCATTSVPCKPDTPQVPSPPSLTQPLPSESYSAGAERLIAEWRKSLTDTPLMSRP